MSGNASRTRGCDICGRPLVSWVDPPWERHPGIDCAGTCFACIHDIEQNAPPEMRGPGPVFTKP